MQRLLLSAMVLAAGFGLGLARSSRSTTPAAAADPPPVQRPPQQNDDLFSYQGVSLQEYSDDNKALKNTGVWNWRFVVVPSCGSESIRAAVTAAVAETSRAGIVTHELAANDSSGHDVYATCGVQFSSGCGGPPVIGCLPSGFPYNNTVYISTDMAAYFDVSQRAIALHEIFGHAMQVWNEQYKLDGTFGSSNDVTIMNTGPLSRHDLGPDEDARTWRTMGSPELRQLGYGFNGAWYVWAGGFDANARRLSILVDRHDGRGIVWAGVLVPLKPDKNGRQGIGAPEGLTIQIGAVYYIKQENAASYLVSLNEARVPNN